MDKLWLPTGRVWDMHILHYQAEDAGAFTGGGWGKLWHTTESPWDAVDSMENVLLRKRAAPHFVIGGRQGTKLPVVVQMIALNRAGRALQNDPSDGKDTNKANKVQTEICFTAAGFGSFTHYEALANLAGLVMHRVPIPNLAKYAFPGARLGDAEFVAARGHMGHCHAPDNDHVDPGHLDARKLVSLIDKLPEGGYPLT